jgi:hypothetical protein
MWEAYSKGKLPYESSITNNEVLQRKLKGEELPKPSMCNDHMWSVIKHCWYSQPEPRFSFEQMKILLSQINLEYVKLTLLLILSLIYRNIRHIHCQICDDLILDSEMANHIG